jgi:AraC family transcriptional regulator, regulatory protein of adaptative response / DNA-3-methyladenine glycosylase II
MGAVRLTREIMLERSRARDPASDGRFWVGVLSTGIFCRPSCRARAPRAENIRFFASVEEARAAGLRPCRRCRPEDFARGHDPERALMERLAARLAEEPAAFADLAAVQEELGIGATRLHGLARRHFHATPRELLVRARIAAARRLLLESDERVLDIAFHVGFESVSAFHAAFLAATCLRPVEYRRLREQETFTLGLPPDFRADLALAFHGRDPASPTERVSGRSLARALSLPGGAALLVIELDAGAAHCSLRCDYGRHRGATAAAHAIALRLLGLPADPRPFERRVAAQPHLATLVDGRRGLRVPQCATPFEGLVWAILGQQIGLPFAYRLRQRLIARCGVPVPGGLTAHPEPAAVAALDEAELVSLQLSRAKSRALLAAARTVAAGELPLDGLAAGPATTLEARLRALPGIGPWSASYVLLRSCGFADCVPVGDAGLNRALTRFFALERRPTPGATTALMARFAPHRSLATTHFWSILGGIA